MFQRLFFEHNAEIGRKDRYSTESFIRSLGIRLCPEQLAITFKATLADRLACLPTLGPNAGKFLVPKLDLDSMA